MILEAAQNAIKKYRAGNNPLPLKIEAPISVEVDFRSSDLADKVEIMPGIIRIDGRRIRFSCETMPDAYCEFRKIVNMAG
jgi:D-amino peptidase